MTVPAEIPSQRMRLLAGCFLLSSLAIIAFTLFAAYHYSSNAVLGKDEANFILLSSEQMLGAHSARDFVHAVFVNHGQHVLFGMQLVNLLTVALTGSLERRVMNVIGVLILTAAGLVLWRSQRTRVRTESMLLLATLLPLILSPAHNACIVNASCTGNHYFGIAFSVFSLFAFTRYSGRLAMFLLAEFLLFLAIFSLSAALALVPVSFLVLWNDRSPQRRQFLILHALVIAALMGWQLALTYPDTIFSFVQEDTSPGLPSLAMRAQGMALTICAILASLFYWLNDQGYHLVFACGGFAILIALLVFARGLDSVQRRSFPFYGALMFFLMIALIAFGRYFSFGSSRYAAYTGFLFAFVFCLWLERRTGARTPLLALSATIALVYYLIALYYHFPYLQALGEKDDICRKLWVNEGYVCGVMISHEEATRITKSAIAKGIYRIEEK